MLAVRRNDFYYVELQRLSICLWVYLYELRILHFIVYFKLNTFNGTKVLIDEQIR